MSAEPIDIKSDVHFLRSVLAASTDCVKVLDLDGKLAFMTDEGQQVMEISDFNLVKGCPWPDFWSGPANGQAKEAIAAARTGKSYRFQAATDTFAGTPKYWDVQVSPIVGRSGAVEAILSVSRDITEQKEAKDRADLLSAELSHRVKNILSLVQSIASQSLRDQDDIDVAKDQFLGRLASLATAHDILTQTSWKSANVVDIVRATADLLAPGRISVDGPLLRVNSRTALALAMALHELGTNASKYGSLANEQGRVLISWSVADGQFDFRWIERDGPAVAPPSRKGFGSRIIEKVLATYVNGVAHSDYRPDGLHFTLSAPVAGLFEAE